MQWVSKPKNQVKLEKSKQAGVHLHELSQKYLHIADLTCRFNEDMSSGPVLTTTTASSTMRTPTLQPVPESLPADHVSSTNNAGGSSSSSAKKKVSSLYLPSEGHFIHLLALTSGYILRGFEFDGIFKSFNAPKSCACRGCVMPMKRCADSGVVSQCI